MPPATANEAEAYEACERALVPSGLTTCVDATLSCGDAGTVGLVCTCIGGYPYSPLSSQCWEYAGPNAGETFFTQSGCPACPPVSGGQPWN